MFITFCYNLAPKATTLNEVFFTFCYKVEFFFFLFLQYCIIKKEEKKEEKRRRGEREKMVREKGEGNKEREMSYFTFGLV